ncbi:class I SAM-dependent methyltransferase [Marinobacterium arenosum]|uniref:class I SAM-dependent methyltransferase n=1 Tax=Marinobacterium arenosum TaxID=2862496 RepID=UPI001C9630BA|nr:class I SAM-dependent methyltransferase [Marinobacterium arenosum]MBY4675344.1 class I SAM-dependent methyltransferase [Marinobacterium arenosum]
MNDTIRFYDQHAEALAAQYDSLTFRQVHGTWLSELSSIPVGAALDVGAGSGRDACALHQRGWRVTAVEPAASLRALGARKADEICWLDDQLPALSNLKAAHHSFGFILLSAVWMHLPEQQRPEALARLVELLAPEGMLVISLRHGPSEPGRPMYPVSMDELIRLSAPHGLTVQELVAGERDCLQRNHVYWQTVILRHRKFVRERSLFPSVGRSGRSSAG